MKVGLKKLSRVCNMELIDFVYFLEVEHFDCLFLSNHSHSGQDKLLNLIMLNINSHHSCDYKSMLSVRKWLFGLSNNKCLQ